MIDLAHECCVGLGGNVGAVEQTLERALGSLETSSCRVLARSATYRSAPMGENAGSEFVNMAVRLQTGLGPADLMQLLQAIESECGRVQTIHWGPRPLDLDLLLYGSCVLTTEQLTIPHPGLWYRRFVLDPLMEFAAGDIHPVFNLSIRQLRARLNRRPLIIEVVDPARTELPLPGRLRKADLCTVRSVTRVTADLGPDDVFARIVVEPIEGDLTLTTCIAQKNFVLAASADHVASLLDSVLTAALGS